MEIYSIYKSSNLKRKLIKQVNYKTSKPLQTIQAHVEPPQKKNWLRYARFHQVYQWNPTIHVLLVPKKSKWSINWLILVSWQFRLLPYGERPHWPLLHKYLYIPLSRIRQTHNGEAAITGLKFFSSFTQYKENLPITCLIFFQFIITLCIPYYAN